MQSFLVLSLGRITDVLILQDLTGPQSLKMITNGFNFKKHITYFTTVYKRASIKAKKKEKKPRKQMADMKI